MTLQSALDAVARNGWDTLRGAAADGLHDLPAGFIAAYDALASLAEQAPPATVKAAEHADLAPLDRVAAEQALRDWRAGRDRQADQLERQCGQALQPYGQTIERYIGSALAARLAVFTADVAVIGPHQVKVVPDDAVVDAAGGSREFADAWLRFTATGSWYLRMRQSWAVLRRYDSAPGGPDPAAVDLDHVLAEVANAAELRPDDWRNLRAGGQGGGSVGIAGPQPWPIPVHTRLAAILRDGGQPWMPSAAQQAAAYTEAAPPAPAARRDLTRPLKPASAA